MRLLVVLKQTNYMLAFAGPVRELAARGHQVHVAFQDGAREGAAAIHDVPGVSYGPVHSKREDRWRRYAPVVRRAADYLRYLEPPYAGARKLRMRALDKLLHTLSGGERTGDFAMADALLGLTQHERTRLKELFQLVEEGIPPDPRTMEFLREQRPDALLISPLIDLGSGQSEFVKAARALGIPTALLLFSWDNLSTKGTMHVEPDRLFVWNERVKQEAVELHGVAPDKVVVTGAPRFDPFFELRPVLSREEFCAPLGFDPARPILMYLCSSKFVSGNELAFLARWRSALRMSGGKTADANLLIRPHPDVKWVEGEGPIKKMAWNHDAVGRAWVTRPFDDPRVILLRTARGQPFFECLHHAALVVGLNTTAEIEAAIAGRPVFTIVSPSAEIDGQATTLHFHYLLAENGGFVQRAADVGEHVRQLESALAAAPDSEGIRKFVQEFVRPEGLDRPVAKVIADHVERCFGSASSRADEVGVPLGRGPN